MFFYFPTEPILSIKSKAQKESDSQIFPSVVNILILPKRVGFFFQWLEVLIFIVVGQERFGNMTRVYYREAMGAFIVFDVTRPATFQAVTKWKEDLDTKLTLPSGKPVPTVLLANKCDQGKEVLVNNGVKMEQFCQENGFVGWYETSAKVTVLCI